MTRLTGRKLKHGIRIIILILWLKTSCSYLYSNLYLVSLVRIRAIVELEGKKSVVSGNFKVYAAWVVYENLQGL